MAEKGLVFTGARARLLVNGVKVGYARNCNGNEQIQMEPVEALDNIQVEENVPTRYRVSFSMGFVRVVRTSLKSLGWFPALGSSPEEHLTNVITQGLLTVTIEDNQTGAVIMTLEQSQITSRNFTVDATGIVAIDADFVGIRMRDESEV